MLTIRLQRAGKKNRPEFRVILAEKTAAASKKFIEVLGQYNPRTKDLVFNNEERLKYWIAQHVTMSPTVHNLLVSKNLVEGPKVKAFSTPKKEVKEEPKAEGPAVPAAEATETPAPEPVAETPAPTEEVAAE